MPWDIFSGNLKDFKLTQNFCCSFGTSITLIYWLYEIFLDKFLRVGHEEKFLDYHRIEKNSPWMMIFLRQWKNVSTSQMLWLSSKRSNCDSNYSTFRLPWVHSRHCPSKNFFRFFAVILKFLSLFMRVFLNGQRSEPIHGKWNGSPIETTAFSFLIR